MATKLPENCISTSNDYKKFLNLTSSIYIFKKDRKILEKSLKTGTLWRSIDDKRVSFQKFSDPRAPVPYLHFYGNFLSVWVNMSTIKHYYYVRLLIFKQRASCVYYLVFTKNFLLKFTSRFGRHIVLSCLNSTL